MKHQKNLFLKTLVSLILAAAVLASGMLMIAASDETSEPLENETLTPDVSEIIENSNAPAVDAPTTLEGEFGAYSFVSEEDGKSVVTIYSAEQIADFVSRRENGEWFSLTAEEMLHLVEDTRALFDNYDIVRVYDLEGKLNTYRGRSFYTSEEFDAAFGLVDEDVDATFNLSKDMHFATLNRLTVLCSAVAQPDDGNSTEITVFFTDVTAYPDEYEFVDGQAELDILGRRVDNYWFWSTIIENDWYETEPLSACEGGALLLISKNNNITNQQAYFISDISALDQNDYTCLYNDHGQCGAGKYEYAYDGKSVVVEVWDENAQKIVARLRLDDTNDAEEVATIEQLWEDIDAYMHSGSYEKVSIDEYFSLSDYTVTVYLNNIDWDWMGGSTVMHYRVDDTCNYWSFGEYSIQPFFQLQGTSEFAAYINSILESRLTAE